MPISAIQTIRGRAVTGMLQAELAEASGVSVKAIDEFEGGKRMLNGPSLQALRAALERAGWEAGSDVRVTRLRGITTDPRYEGSGDQLV
jgi:transcriptional regulator with XRE-family HTH domain